MKNTIIVKAFYNNRVFFLTSICFIVNILMTKLYTFSERLTFAQ